MVREELSGNWSKKYGPLLEIDARLDRLVHRIELLAHINPLDIEKVRSRFFASNYGQEPRFNYPEPKFDPHKLHRSLLALPLEKIEDGPIRSLYTDLVQYYGNMLQCIGTVGRGRDFYHHSLQLYGTPAEGEVENARYILQFGPETADADMEKIFSAQEAKAYFEDFAGRYDFPLKVRFSTNLASDAMVSNRDRTLLIKKGIRLSKKQMSTLANHEIGVHLVTTYNGLEQPLKIFSNGFPRNVETQEGLAVFSEYLGGALTLSRLKELAYRVLAVDTLTKDHTFCDTFDLIHGQYGLEREEAFSICLRVHRGGGFTKDRLYLSGLQKINKRHRAGLSMDRLLIGKVALEYEGTIEYLQDLGLVGPMVHQSRSFDQNLNTDRFLDLILKGLN